jgi:hypothetical protein
MLLHHCDFPLSESSEPFMAQGEVGWTSPCWEGGAKTHCGCLAIDPGSYSFYVWPPVLWILTCDFILSICSLFGHRGHCVEFCGSSLVKYSFLVLVSTFISCNEVVARFAAVVIHRKEIWTHILAESTRGLTIFHWFSLRRLDFCQRIKPRVNSMPSGTHLKCLGPYLKVQFQLWVDIYIIYIIIYIITIVLHVHIPNHIPKIFIMIPLRGIFINRGAPRIIPIILEQIDANMIWAMIFIQWNLYSGRKTWSFFAWAGLLGKLFFWGMELIRS